MRSKRSADTVSKKQPNCCFKSHLFLSFDLMNNGSIFIFNSDSRRVCGVGKGQQCFVLRLFHSIKAILLPALGQLNGKFLLTGRSGDVRLFREKPEKIITESVSRRKSNRPRNSLFHLTTSVRTERIMLSCSFLLCRKLRECFQEVRCGGAKFYRGKIALTI